MHVLNFLFIALALPAVDLAPELIKYFGELVVAPPEVFAFLGVASFEAYVQLCTRRPRKYFVEVVVGLGQEIGYHIFAVFGEVALVVLQEMLVAAEEKLAKLGLPLPVSPDQRVYIGLATLIDTQTGTLLSPVVTVINPEDFCFSVVNLRAQLFELCKQRACLRAARVCFQRANRSTQLGESFKQALGF